MKYQIYEGVDVMTYGSHMVCFDLMSLNGRNCNDLNANNCVVFMSMFFI